MFCYIDESGIHRQVGLSVFTAVSIKDACLSEIEDQVRLAERRLGLGTFHWRESSWPVKHRFFQNISNLPFEFSARIFANPIKPEQALRDFLVEFLEPKSIDTVFIDGTKPKWYGSSLKKFLRDNQVSIRNIKMVDDGRMAGLRIADFVAGAIRVYAEGSRHTGLEKIHHALLKHQTPSAEGVR